MVVAILMSDKVKFKLNTMRRDKEGHFIKVTFHIHTRNNK